MKTVHFDAGDTIISQGEDGDTAFLIVKGAVEVAVGIGKDAKTVGRLEAGEVFGEMSLIEPGERSATVKAVSATECVETSFEEFVGGISDDPKAALTFIKTLVQRLRHMNALVATMDPAKRTMREVFSEWQRSSEAYETGKWAAAEHDKYDVMTSWRTWRMI